MLSGVESFSLKNCKWAGKLWCLVVGFVLAWFLWVDFVGFLVFFCLVKSFLTFFFVFVVFCLKKKYCEAEGLVVWV